MAVRFVLFDLFGTLVQYDAGRVSQDFTRTIHFLREVYKPVQRPEHHLGAELSYAAGTELINDCFLELEAASLAREAEFSMFDVAERLFTKLGLKGFGEEPSAYKEPSAGKEPSANTEPSASREPSASKEPSANKEPSALQKQFTEHYVSDWSKPVVPVHGVQPFLSKCASQFQLALVSNTHYEPMVLDLLKKFQLEQFSQVVASVTHGRPKPHPQIFLDTLQRLGAKPEECVFVGDNYRADYLGATGVGIPCYLIGRHARVPREYQIPSVIDLPLHLIR